MVSYWLLNNKIQPKWWDVMFNFNYKESVTSVLLAFFYFLFFSLLLFQYLPALTPSYTHTISFSCLWTWESKCQWFVSLCRALKEGIELPGQQARTQAFSPNGILTITTQANLGANLPLVTRDLVAEAPSQIMLWCLVHSNCETLIYLFYRYKFVEKCCLCPVAPCDCCQ